MDDGDGCAGSRVGRLGLHGLPLFMGQTPEHTRSGQPKCFYSKKQIIFFYDFCKNNYMNRPNYLLLKNLQRVNIGKLT